MGIHVHIEANSPAELRGHLEGLLAAVAGGVVPAPEKTAAPKQTKAAAPKAEPTPTSLPAGKAEEPKAPSSTPPSNGSAEEVGLVIAKLAKAKGREETLKLLGKYGAKRGQEVKTEDHAKFLDEAKKLLGA